VRCVKHGWRASLHNPPQTRRVDFLLDGKVVRRDKSAPFRATLLERFADDDRHRHTVAARVPHGLKLSARVRACRSTETNVT
jgi:hypothetical protein